MVEFIKRSRQTATNQPIGVVRITNDDGGQFRADMAMADAIRGVADFSLKKAKQQFEEDDLEAAASQPIFSRNENGDLEPNSFEKAPGFLGIGERERSTQAQNLYNKRFAIATENALNAEALDIANSTGTAAEFEEKYKDYTAKQLELINRDFDPLLAAQYQMAAAEVGDRYITGKLKSAHIKAEQLAVTDLTENAQNGLRDVLSFFANGQVDSGNELLNVIVKSAEAEFSVNNQFTTSAFNNLIQAGIRSSALGTILNIKQTPGVDSLTITTLLDKGLRDGSYRTEEFGQQLIEAGLSPEQAVSLRTVFNDATIATENNIAQIMSAIKDEEKAGQITFAISSVLKNGNPTEIASLDTSNINAYVTPQFVLNVLADDVVPGEPLKENQQNLINLIKSRNQLPAAFEKQVEDILDGTVRDERTVRNAMTLLRYGAYNKDGLMRLRGINENAVGFFYAALKVNGGNFLEAQKQTFKFSTGAAEVLRENYAKITQRFGIPTDDMDFDSGTLKSKGMSTIKEHLAGVLSDVLGGNAEDFTNQRLLDTLVPAALQIYSTLNNPDLVMKEYIKGNIVKTKYLADENHSSIAPERFFSTEEDEKQFFDIANRKIAENQEIEIPLVSYAVPKIDGLGFANFETVERTPNLLGDNFFLKYDRRSTETEPRYYVVDEFDRVLKQSNGELLFIDFRTVAANNALKLRMKKNKSIQDAARRNAIKGDAEKTAQLIARGRY